MTSNRRSCLASADPNPQTEERRCPMRNLRLITLALALVAIALLLAEGPVGPF